MQATRIPYKYNVSRRFSFDIDSDLSASKLRKNSLTGRNATLDSFLRSKFPGLSTVQDKDHGKSRKAGNKKMKPKMKLTLSHKQPKVKPENAPKFDYKIDEGTLNDFNQTVQDLHGNDDIFQEFEQSVKDFNDNTTKIKVGNHSQKYLPIYPNLQPHNELQIYENTKDANGKSQPECTTKTNSTLTVNDDFELTKEETQSLEASEQDIVVKDKYSLYRFNIIPDGNCLYRAISQAVFMDDDYHLVLRQETVNYIETNIKDFENILEEGVDGFLKKAANEGEWAGYPEILAMTRLLNININITTGGTLQNPNVQTTCHYYFNDKECAGRKNKLLQRQKSYTRPTVWLSWLSSGHYDLLIDEKRSNIKYDEWLQAKNERTLKDAEMAAELSKACINKRPTSKPKPKHKYYDNYDVNKTSSFSSLLETSSNEGSDCSSSYDFDLLKHSDLYA